MKKVSLAIFSVILILLVGSVSAQETVVDTSSYNWWDNFMHELEQLGLFTAAGQARQCSINADICIGPTSFDSSCTGDFASGSYSSAFLLAPCQSSALINFFNSNGGFIDEYQIESMGSGININGEGILQVYCCPYTPCYSHSDCDDPFGDTCNTLYNSCSYSGTSYHETDVYECINLDWVYQGDVDYGDDNWCLDEDDNNYIDESGNEHCANSPSSVWCASCNAHNKKLCVFPSNNPSGIVYWYDSCGTREEVYDSCGVGELCKDPSPGGNAQCQEDCGETNNKKCFGDESWFIDSCENKDDLHQDCGAIGLGCDVQTGECGTIDFCTDGQEDCLDETSYLLCENGQWVDKGLVVGECGHIGNGDGEVETETITWTEYYSMSDEKFTKGNYRCKSTSDCPTKEGYTVTCDEDNIFEERSYKSTSNACDKSLGWLDEISSLLLKITPTIADISLCDAYGKGAEWIKSFFRGEDYKGFCMASSNSWYGGLWETSMKTVGGMGLPANFVMIITVMLLIAIIGMLIKMVK